MDILPTLLGCFIKKLGKYNGVDIIPLIWIYNENEKVCQKTINCSKIKLVLLSKN